LADRLTSQNDGELTSRARRRAEAAPGRRFGSPEALALHRLNALDAGVKDAGARALEAT